MPFPKGVKRAMDIVDEIKGTPLVEFEDKELLLKSFTIKTSQAFGDLVTLDITDEDGKDHRLYTFSAVIVDQCRELEDRLPLIIKPRKVDRYMVIY